MGDIVRNQVARTNVALVRPANTTTYAAGQAMANATSGAVPLMFESSVINDNYGGMIIDAVMIDEANQATKADVELWLFNVSPAGVINDGAAFAPTVADIEALATILYFPSTNWKVGLSGSGVNGNCANVLQNVGAAIHPVSGTGATLYGVPVVRNAYVPISAGKFVFKLRVAC